MKKKNNVEIEDHSFGESIIQHERVKRKIPVHACKTYAKQRMIPPFIPAGAKLSISLCLLRY